MRRRLCGGGRERRLDVEDRRRKEAGWQNATSEVSKYRTVEGQTGGCRGAKSMGKRQEAKKAFIKAMTPIRRVEV